MPRDLMLYNGSIHTMDPRQPVVEAILVREGHILACGADEAVCALGSDAQEIDLAGRTALPGLEDAHLHLCMHGMALSRIRLEQMPSLEATLHRVQQAALDDPEASWIRGSGWDHNLWPTDSKPTRQDLDHVVPHRPVALDSKDRHSLWVNSAALRLAGIDANTVDVPGGEIVRDDAGEPTGILTENARQLIDAAIPAPTRTQWRQAARVALADAARLGLTAVHSCEGPDAFGALAALEQADELTLRVWHMLPLRHLEKALALGLVTGYGSDRLRVGHVKMFADGALGSGTAEMLAPYEKQPGQYGVAATSDEVLYDAVRRAARGGLASAIHAIGDKANRRVLDLYERVANEEPGIRLRQRIEHVQLLSPKDLPRLGRLGIIASMQPIHATQDMTMAERQWGTRCRHAYAWRSLQESGAPLAFGTDAPVEGLDPLPNLYATVTRRRGDGTPETGWYPEERLDLDEAIHAYTMGSAYAAYQETSRGSLTPGKLGDLTVLSHDIYAGTAEILLETQVDLTIVGGQIVYER